MSAGRSWAPGESPGTVEVAVHAPTGRDGPLTVSILERWGVTARLCPSIENLCDAITDGVGVLVIAEEALSPGPRETLLRELRRQPSWSDIPLIILTGEGELSRPITASVDAVAARANAILLERPIRIATLVTALRSALRARARQFEIRNYVAEREHLLESERDARAEAEEANLAKTHFLAVMSHELRTPLNAIGGYAELLALGVHGALTNPQHEAVRRIQTSERHLLGLIERVLSFARVEAGTVRFDVAPVSIAELVSTAETLVEPQMRSLGLELEVIAIDDGHYVSADAEKAQQILLNLLSNAMKFTPRGGRITIASATRDDCVEISVGDSGVGIPADKIESIFEPFVQIDTRLTRTHEGLGLGLAISRDLARGMGGNLTATSRLGAGACFTLTLPRSAPSLKNAELAAADGR